MIERSLAVTKVSSFPCKGNFSYAMRIRNASVNGKYSSCPTLLFHITIEREYDGRTRELSDYPSDREKDRA